LRELRQTLRWTQKRAAKACGIGHKLFQLYELGVKKNPELFTLQKIAKGFRMGVHELLSPAPVKIPKHSIKPRCKPGRKRREPRKNRG
jgi:transcriptional regulator with XRE-family HTH domain